MVKLPEIIERLTADAVTFGSAAAGVSVPGGTAAGAIKEFFDRREKQAREILIEEIRSGKIADHQMMSEDDAIAVYIRYLNAAREGRARLNLRLLAKAIAGQLRRGELVADEFLAHSETLASLSRDEIVVIGTMFAQKEYSDEQKRIQPSVEPPDPWKLTKKKLCPETYPTTEYVEAIAARGQRSGLIQFVSAYGGAAYKVTPLMDELATKVDFLDALKKEEMVGP